ncbi:hypothetical protein J5N97_006753 [Dioscorea zingiberensis]|uniref:Uncharacterized protein n=1 Tax=Dioscorea zingiberensis TaxID=325984 RepID=A0A9D5HUB2_9LILI|nr:hypothetical protein J5N97_006753 [Dioscorea zingiberensis]
MRSPLPSLISPSIPIFPHRNPSPNLSSTPPTRPRDCRSRCACKRGGRSWDSNAESFRAGRFGLRDDAGGGFWKRGRRRWWPDESSSDEAEFGDDVDDDDDAIEPPWEIFGSSKGKFK